jgi:hypothetical protein
MKNILLQGNSNEEIKLITALAKKMGMKTKVIKNDFMEDIALANSMQKGRTSEYVDTQEYLNKLKAR